MLPNWMNKRFQDVVDALDGHCQALLTMTPIVASDVPSDTPVGGVYLFSEGSMHLYAGRTKRSIAVRIRDHFSTASDCRAKAKNKVGRGGILTASSGGKLGDS